MVFLLLNRKQFRKKTLMTSKLLRLITVILGILMVMPAYSEPVIEGGRELTDEELKSSIGRYGEGEEIPEDFEFSEAETKLWLSNHLGNITQPARLYYEFVKSGSYEEGFSDAVYLDVIEFNEDGTKNVVLDFFTGARKQAVQPDNVTHVRGNPVLGIYMQGDVYEMNRLTDGSWRHFMKMIKIALRKQARVEKVTFDFNGKQYEGDKIIFNPYENDPHRMDFLKFADKTYEIILSKDIPGTLFQIKTVISDNSKEDVKESLIEERITLIEANFSADKKISGK